MSRAAATLLVVLLLAGVTGCASLFHKPRPVQRQLAEAGLTAAPGPVAEQRAYCTARTQPAW